MPSPLFRINGEAVGVPATVAPGGPIVATLDSTDGVRQVQWFAAATDETAEPADYVLVQSGSVGQTVSTTALAEGTSVTLRAKINDGLNLSTQLHDPIGTEATGKAQVLTAAGFAVASVNEKLEASAAYGWTAVVNPSIRASILPGSVVTSVSGTSPIIITGSATMPNVTLDYSLAPTATKVPIRGSFGEIYAGYFAEDASGIATVGTMRCSETETAVAFRNDAGTDNVLGLSCDIDNLRLGDTTVCATITERVKAGGTWSFSIGGTSTCSISSAALTTPASITLASAGTSTISKATPGAGPGGDVVVRAANGIGGNVGGNLTVGPGAGSTPDAIAGGNMTFAMQSDGAASGTQSWTAGSLGTFLTLAYANGAGLTSITTAKTSIALDAPTSLLLKIGGVTKATQTTGALSLAGAVTVGTTLATTGAATLGSTLAVTGAATIGNGLAVTTGATTLGSTLLATGATTLSSTLAVTGATTIGGLITASAGANVTTADLALSSGSSLSINGYGIISEGGGIVSVGSDGGPGITIATSDGPSVAVTADGSKKMEANTTGIGFFAATPVAKPTVTGSRALNPALASLLTALATLGLITDSSS